MCNHNKTNWLTQPGMFIFFGVNSKREIDKLSYRIVVKLNSWGNWFITTLKPALNPFVIFEICITSMTIS